MIGLKLDPRSLIGERVLLCCYWQPTLGLFTVRNSFQVFRQEGGQWVGLPTSVGQVEKLAFSSEELRALLRQVDISELARKAERIVIGRVSALADSTLFSSEQVPIRLQRVTLAVDSALKGDRSLRTIWFLSAASSAPELGGVVSPRVLKIGETWVVFLGRVGNVNYPLGGVNGLLLLDGEKVFFDRVVEAPYSRSALTRAVSEIIDE